MMRSKAEPDQFADWLQGPLLLACDAGNADLVDKLLEAGAGIAAGGIGKDGRTLLHAAAASGNECVVSALLRTPARADINIKSASHAHWRYRGTPLQVAVRGGHESVARTLIAAGADLALALTMAVRRGQERIAYDLLLAGADPNEADTENAGGDSATPLALAAEQGFEQLVRALLHKGATEPPPRATRVRTAGAVLQSATSKGPAAAAYTNGKNSTSRSRRTRQATPAAADEDKREEVMMPEKNMILMQQRHEERRRLQTQSHKLRKEKKAAAAGAAAATALPPLPPTTSKTASPRRATLPLSASSPSPVFSRSVVPPPALRTHTPPRISAEERDKKAVSAAAIAWKNTVTSGARDAPRRTAALYAEDGSLWETVSEEVCSTPQQITAHFERFVRLPQLRMVEYTPVAARVYGDFAVLAGTYTFAWRGEDGGPVEKRARFSFKFRRDRTRGAPRPWLIVEHHSSSMPTAPAAAAAATAAEPPEPVDSTPPLAKAAKIRNDPNADQRAVAAAMMMWTRAVTLGTDEAPRKTAALYAKDATLWGSVSDAIRDTPDLIYKYLDKFCRLPELRLVDFAPVTVRVYGDFAVQAGTYTFSWRGEGGGSVERQARFTFTFRRDGNPGNPCGWSIVEHHAVPVGLSRVSSGVDLADLSKSLADVRSATATAPPSTTTYSAASMCDEHAIDFDETGSMAGESDGGTDADLGDMPSPATAASAAPKTTRRRGLLVSSGSILATILTDPPSSSSILATVMTIPPAMCAAICVGGLAGALLGLSTVAFLMGSGTSSSDLEAAPPVASAAVNALRFFGRMASV
ncbi:unnamed protein product [Ectocarpus sp. CCAP 1310/34]|nr:unnamed protein product [Ectocarpus sp. CCAP 1310/34]